MYPQPQANYAGKGKPPKNTPFGTLVFSKKTKPPSNGNKHTVPVSYTFAHAFSKKMTYIIKKKLAIRISSL